MERSCLRVANKGGTGERKIIMLNTFNTNDYKAEPKNKESPSSRKGNYSAPNFTTVVSAVSERGPSKKMRVLSRGSKQSYGYYRIPLCITNASPLYTLRVYMTIDNQYRHHVTLQTTTHATYNYYSTLIYQVPRQENNDRRTGQ